MAKERRVKVSVETSNPMLAKHLQHSKPSWDARLVPAQHASDCAVHNEPAYPAGPCNCGAEVSA